MTVQETKKFVRLRNPYTFGVPVRGSDNFFGREEELRLILNTLENVPRGQKQDLVILGPRRIGKSSLLYQLRYLLDKHSDFVPVYVDVQSIKPQKTRPLFVKIARDIQKGYQDKNPAHQFSPFDTLSQNSIPPDLEYLTFGDDMERLNDTIGRYGLPRLVLMFDEVELLLEIGGRDMLGWLRSLIQSLSYCVFIVAGSDQLYSLTQDYGSPFYNIFKTIELFPLSDKAAWRLFVEPMREIGMVVKDADIQKILYVTGNTPYFIQGIAHYLVEELNGQQQYAATETNVEKVIEACVQYLSPQFLYLWNIVASRPQQILLYALAKRKRPQPLSNLVARFPILKELLPTEKNQQQAFQDLVQQQILKLIDSKNHWFVVPLFVDWILSRMDDEAIVRLSAQLTTPELTRPELLPDLRKRITKTFTHYELQQMAFDLDLDWENIRGSVTESKVNELILYLIRYDRLPDLLAYLQQARPNVNWPELKEA